MAELGGAVGEGKKLEGLYPWFCFEGLTREQWGECYGIDLRHIDQEGRRHLSRR